MDDERNAECGACGFVGTINDFDVCGACPGNMFCNQCWTEFSAMTGEPTLLCGECTGCEWLKQDDEWEATQERRNEKLEQFKQREKTSDN